MNLMGTSVNRSNQRLLDTYNINMMMMMMRMISIKHSVGQLLSERLFDGLTPDLSSSSTIMKIACNIQPSVTPHVCVD